MKKLYEEASVQAIADAIRAKAGTADTYKIAEMPYAIASLPSGGGAAEPYIEETYDSSGNLIEAKLFGYTMIRDHAFYECRLLSSVSLPSETTVIGHYSFYYCQDLALESLPDGLTRIGNNAFRFCTNLALNSIPEGVTNLGAKAFYGCTGLTSITFEGTPTAIQSTAFTGCTNLITINVPWTEGAVAGAPWGATNATINYNYTGA